MAQLSNDSKKLLLELARGSIEDVLSKTENTSNLKKTAAELSDDIKERSGVFVTLTIDGKLRGCIGSIEPVQTIYGGVMANAKSAAFTDPRFPPVQKSELDNLSIEISVLTKPKKLNFRNERELVSYLEKNKPGVVISVGNLGATFLPQVWEDIPEPEKFLSHLCQKAGVSPRFWKDRPEETEVKVYTVEKFSESDFKKELKENEKG